MYQSTPPHNAHVTDIVDERCTVGAAGMTVGEVEEGQRLQLVVAQGVDSREVEQEMEEGEGEGEQEGALEIDESMPETVELPPTEHTQVNSALSIH